MKTKNKSCFSTLKTALFHKYEYIFMCIYEYIFEFYMNVNFSDCMENRPHKHLMCKGIRNYLAKMVECLFIN